MNNPRMPPNHKIPSHSPLVMMSGLTTALPPGSEFVSKKVIPIKRTAKSINYVVGLITFEQSRAHQDQQQDDGDVQEEPPKQIEPPYVLCMNFSQIKPEKPPEVLDLCQDNKSNDAFLPGSMLDRENALLKAWMKKFWDYQTRIPSCCDYTKKFWEWVFLLWPESKFKWNFKNLDRKWFEYMISFPLFREALRKWMTENEEEVIKEIEKKAQYANKAGKMAAEIKTIISDLNDKLFMDLQNGKAIQEEPNQQELKSLIDNGGILVTYDPSIVTSRCEEHVSEKLLSNPDEHAPLLKNFNKNLKKRREKPKLDSPIFKYVVTDGKTKQESSDKKEDSLSIDHIKIEMTRRDDKSSEEDGEEQ